MIHLIQNPSDWKDLKEYVRESGYKNILPLSPVCKQEDLSAQDFLAFAFKEDEKFSIEMSKFGPWYKEDIKTWIRGFFPKEDLSDLIFGKNKLNNIVSCEADDSIITLFLETPSGVHTQVIDNRYWLMATLPLDPQFVRLKGDLYYKYIKYYTDKDKFEKDKKRYYHKDVFTAWDNKESALILNGFTYFKGMKVEDISVLSFDIESTSLKHDETAKVLLIANTFKKNGVITRKMFCYNDYTTEAEYFDAWCTWVREINPSILIGHNVVIYDFPYLDFCAKQAGTSLKLGRDGSDVEFNKKESKVRVDGSQAYSYKKVKIYGREVVDTFFVALKYDLGKKYKSYKLKSIIEQEGLEVKDRQFYDASTIRDNYTNPEEWEKIKKYAEHDGDDALELFKFMIPSFFYLSQTVPKSFQQITESASGSQINSFLIRSYLQDGHSIPKATEVQSFEGAISFGVPGVYKNMFKIDLVGLYPSIMRQYKVYDKVKDPKGNFLKMLEYFTTKRLEYKKLAKETGDQYYKDMDQTSKVVANSCYGMMGAAHLNFNSIHNAAFVTQKGREILKFSIKWATGKDYEYWNNLFKEKTE